MRRRMPIRYQLTSAECGLACLAMVATYHRRNTTVADCRAFLAGGRDGVSVDELAIAAERLGMRARLDRGGELPERLRAPIIAHLARHHFVAVASADSRTVGVVDPGLGRLRMSREEFMRSWSGTALHLSPGEGFVRQRASLKQNVIALYLRHTLSDRTTRYRVALALVLAACLQVLALASPLLTKAIVDGLMPGGHRTPLRTLVLGVGTVCAVYGLLSVARGLVMLTVRIRGDQYLSRRFVSHLLRLPIGFFLERGRGDLLMRLSSVSGTRETLIQQVMSTGIDAILLVGYLVGILYIQPLYGIVIIPLALVQTSILLGSYSRLRSLAQRELRTKTEEQSYLVEALEAVVSLKANGAEDRALERWESLFDRSQRATRERGLVQAVVSGGRQAVTVLGPMVMLLFGAWLVDSGRMGLGDVLAINAMALAVTAPLETFVATGQMLQVVRAQVERIFDVLDTPAEPSGGTAVAGHDDCAIDLRGVGFSYAAPDSPALRDITLAIPAGSKLGVVGASGSGKSTFGLVALGLLRATSGVVSHDGVSVADLDLSQGRGRCGAVLQDLTLFNGSIWENLVLFRPDATLEQVTESARAAGLHDDVLALPLGYDTIVGQGGGALSAGQRQRVALARALVHQPRVLLLDEATSHLDPLTESVVDDALGKLAVTRIVISHRLSAIRNSDQIIVLDAGRVVARGSHDELISRPGKYRDLFAGTARSFAMAQQALDVSQRALGVSAA